MVLGSWRKFTMNPEAIASVFGDSDPSLRDVKLSKGEFSDDGPTLYLDLEINDYPSNPPIRWKRVPSNTVVIQFQCLGIQSLSIGMSFEFGKVSCEISQGEGGHIEISISGSTTTALVRCGFIRVNHVTPYMRDDSREAV